MYRGTERRPGWRRQRGFALLVSLLVLVIGAATLYVAATTPGSRGASTANPSTAEALARAREIVMSRALADDQRPGSLPCASPDTGGSGTYNGDDCDAEFGRFPYRTLDSAILRDADDEPLWYVLDPALRDRISQQPINPEEKTGALQIGDREHFAAVIMAPRAPLEGHVDGVRDEVDEYFEAGNDVAPLFARCEEVSDCNDRLRGISVDELFDKVQQRVLKVVTERLAEFYEDSAPVSGNRYLPYAEGFGGGGCASEDEPGQLPVTDDENGQGDCGEALEESEFPDWIVANEWLGMIVDPACTQAQRTCAATSLSLDDKRAHAIVGAPGRPLAEAPFNQDREGSGVDVADYLESSENTDLDSDYENRRLTRNHNDVISGIGGEWP